MEKKLIHVLGPSCVLASSLALTQHGGKWSGDYYVVDAEAFTGAPEAQRAYVHSVKEILDAGKIDFPVNDGILLRADPVERACAQTEGNTVLQPEQGPLDRVAKDLSYQAETSSDSGAGAGG